MQPECIDEVKFSPFSSDPKNPIWFLQGFAFRSCFVMDLTGVLNLTRSEKPTALLNRLRKFLPEIAAANTNLSSATECDIEIITVDHGSSASSSTDSDDESEVNVLTLSPLDH